MYKTLIIALLAVLMLVTGCTSVTGIGRTVGSGRPASQDFQITDFDSVDIDSAFNVSLTQGDGYKVTVRTDDNLLRYISVTMEGSTLRIRANDRNIALFSPRIQEAHITMPRLNGVKLNGASQATMSGFEQVERFVASVNGNSKLSGAVEATDIIVKADGSSRSDLNGQGTTLNLTANGASRVDLSALSVQKATVRLDGASNASVYASASLDYDLNGVSRLSYAGSPYFGLTLREGAATITNW